MLKLSGELQHYSVGLFRMDELLPSSYIAYNDEETPADTIVVYSDPRKPNLHFSLSYTLCPFDKH